MICTLGSGTAFGESILYDAPRNATIITSSVCELLRVEQKDFKILWAVNNFKFLLNIEENFLLIFKLKTTEK